MRTMWDVIKGPMITEKALRLKEDSSDGGQQVLAFRVANDASKGAIKQAVETVFKVKVAAVRVVNYHGKEVRRGRAIGRRPDWKKAYVTLARGERTIDYGDSI